MGLGLRFIFFGVIITSIVKNDGGNMINIPLSKSVKLISPRLTVLINTVDEEGELNSSPYSWIFPLSFNPPLIGELESVSAANTN